MDSPLAPLMLIAELWLLAGIALALRVRLRERVLLGEVVARSSSGRRWRAVGLAAVALAAVCAVLARDELGLGLSLPLCALTALALALLPGQEDRVCGRGGVRRGWYVRALSELEEWRLTGEHLRFRLRGRWEAVPVPRGRLEQVAERVRAAAPDRESPFRD